MAKKKTRKQKILADSRHVTYHLETEKSAQVSLPREKKQKIELPDMPKVPQVMTLNSYSHVITDLKKTAIVTGVILLAQIVIFIALNSM